MVLILIILLFWCGALLLLSHRLLHQLYLSKYLLIKRPELLNLILRGPKLLKHIISMLEHLRPRLLHLLFGLLLLLHLGLLGLLELHLLLFQ